MRIEKEFHIGNEGKLQPKILKWLERYEVTFLLDSNQENNQLQENRYSSYDLVVAAGVLDQIPIGDSSPLSELDKFLSFEKDWYFGYLTYDLKNHIEKLTSENPDHLNWPVLHFIRPEILILIRNNTLRICLDKNSKLSHNKIFEEIQTSIAYSNNEIQDHSNYGNKQTIQIHSRLDRNEYLDKINQIKKHIARGDIYEMNFCQEYYAETTLDPYIVYSMLNKVSPTPFSCFVRHHNKFLISASPERFLKKRAKKIITQPIKGTIKRGKDQTEDAQLIETLRTDKKERAENIMIVDLVRNDLSKIAKSRTVTVEELCGIYTFRQLHQMISTISAELNTDSFEKIIRATFPMGSMTGAPKIRAMKLAEKYESTKRGLYSGAVGYITPDLDFDFNVIIRSLQYNNEKQYLSYMVGSAITSLSVPENEYDECLLKASAIEQVLIQ